MGSALTFHNPAALAIGIACAWLVILWAAFHALRRGGRLIPGTASGRLLLACCIAAAALQCFTTARHAAELSISDSVEYAVGADRIYSLGSYDLAIEGRSLPPRYQPFFPLLFGVPAHAIFHSGLGSPVYLVFAFSMLAFLAAWTAAFRAGGSKAAVAATALICILPEFRRISTAILSDGPIVSAALLLLLLFVSIERKSAKTLDLLAAGILTALAVLFRSVNLFFILPFLPLLRSGKPAETAGRTLALLLPAAAAAAAIAVCNEAVFGSYGRTGYHFWLSVPTDFPSLLFSAGYVPVNLGKLVGEGGSVLLIVVALAHPLVMKALAARNGSPVDPAPETKQALLFCALLGAGSALVFLPYFWPDPRFFAPLVVCLTVPVGIALGRAWEIFRVKDLTPIILGALVIMGASRLLFPAAQPRLEAAERISSQTPQDAVIISALDPVYLEPLALRGTKRQLIPFSRSVEFASKICRLVPAPAGVAPRSALDHRAPGLMDGDCIDPVAHTALEESSYVRSLVESGRAVILDTALITERQLAQFKNGFNLTPAGEKLFRITAAAGSN